MSTPRHTPPAHVLAGIARRESFLIVTVENLAGIAQRSLDRGDATGARLALGEARPYRAELARLQALRAPR